MPDTAVTQLQSTDGLPIHSILPNSLRAFLIADIIAFIAIQMIMSHLGFKWHPYCLTGSDCKKNIQSKNFR
jgi:hypothetical protein